MVVRRAVGREYPRSYAQMRAWFDEDWKCLDYLDWLRWPDGFVCPHCASVVGWRLADSRWKCGGCDRKVSATAGTIFDKTRTPLTVWFATAWRMVGDKIGVSATQVQREMGLGSYQTAWAMLHRYRSVMVRPGRDRLRGDVEVDESFLGGPEPGVRGRRVGQGVVRRRRRARRRRFRTSQVRPDTRREREELGHVLGGQCRTRLGGDHRRLVGLSWRDPGQLPAYRHLGGCIGPAGARGAASGPPSLRIGQALAAGDHAGLGQP